MDSTANEIDHPDINVSGFPTLKFFPAHSGGKVLDYDGARETGAMLEFIHKNAGIKFDVPDYEVNLGEDDEHDGKEIFFIKLITLTILSSFFLSTEL